MGELHHHLVARDGLAVEANAALPHEPPRLAPGGDEARGEEEVDDADAGGRDRERAQLAFPPFAIPALARRT